MPNEFFRRKPLMAEHIYTTVLEYAPTHFCTTYCFFGPISNTYRIAGFGSTSVVTAIKKNNNTPPDWKVNLYPNPNDGQFSLFINKNGKYLMHVYNMLGEIVKSGEITEQYTFNLKNLPSGQYLLELIDTKDTNQKQLNFYDSIISIVH